MPQLQTGIRVARTFQALEQRANPRRPNQPEAVPWILYDTQTYVDNSTTELTFFAAGQSDRSLSNLATAGSLPHPNFFELHYVMLDVIPTAATAWVTTAAGGVAGILDDLGMLLVSGRGFWTLTLSDKDWGPFPVQALHGSGGPTGGGWGTFTAEESLQFANNSIPDGGFHVGGTLIIPPKVGFRMTMRWPAAVNLTADYRLRLNLLGFMYRRVA